MSASSTGGTTPSATDFHPGGGSRAAHSASGPFDPLHPTLNIGEGAAHPRPGVSLQTPTPNLDKLREKSEE